MLPMARGELAEPRQAHHEVILEASTHGNTLGCPLKALDLILSLSKDEARTSCFSAISKESESAA
jgi:hypothetical protein